MYLSRLTLNPFCHRVRKDLANIQELHRTVCSAFPDFETPLFSLGEQGQRILFRVETDHQIPRVLVQSTMEPDWTNLMETGALLESCDGENPAIKKISGTYDKLEPGQILTFRLRANPTKKVETQSKPDGSKNNGRRVFLCREEEQIEWLRVKADKGGFSLLARGLSGEPDLRTLQENPVKGQRGDKTISFGSVLFEGHLRILDRDKFLNTLRGGLGSAKSYGFGLLSIAMA